MTQTLFIYFEMRNREPVSFDQIKLAGRWIVNSD